MWTRPLLKENAKNILRGNYWNGFLVCFIFSLLSGVCAQFSVIYQTASDSTYDMETGEHVIFIIVCLFFALIALCLTVLVLRPIAVGMSRYFLEARIGNAPISTLFSTFRNAAYWNVVKVTFLRDLKIILWSFLLIVPGIYKAYQYRMIDGLLAENPYLSADRAFTLSTQMTNGEKWNIFVLDLSFIGWCLLGTLCCGVGTLFIAPYMNATFAELYTALRTKAFSLGVTDDTELAGFVRY